MNKKRNKNEEAYAYADHKTFFRKSTLKEVDNDDYDQRFRDAKEDFLAGYDTCVKIAEEAFRLFVEKYCAESGRKDISEDSEHYVKVFNELINS